MRLSQGHSGTGEQANLFQGNKKTGTPTPGRASLASMHSHTCCIPVHVFPATQKDRSIDAVSEIFLTFKSCLGLHAYAEGVVDAKNLLIEMYHKSTHPDSKTRILSEFKKDNSTIRCVVATVALGMGIDLKDVDMIVHIGCPKSLLSYLQEAGRCARDGRNGLSIVLYNNFTLSLKSTSKDIADIIKNDRTCIRQQVVDALTVGEKIGMNTAVCTGCDSAHCDCASCRCCSICIKKCPCQEKNQFGYVKFISE